MYIHVREGVARSESVQDTPGHQILSTKDMNYSRRTSVASGSGKGGSGSRSTCGFDFVFILQEWFSKGEKEEPVLG